MNDFEQKLLRLKNAIGIAEDQEIAAILGMSKAAFSARKKRDAFPDDKVYALAAREPDAQVDVEYVLTGSSAKENELQRRLQAIRSAVKKAAAMGLPDVYTHALQQLFFFIELGDMDAVRTAIRQIAEAGAKDTSLDRDASDKAYKAITVRDAPKRPRTK